MENNIRTRTKQLDNIDLTGKEPVIKTKVIEEKIPVVTIDVGPEGNNPKSTIMKRNAVKCEMCLEEVSKYTCPSCKVKTCCLVCVQKHKRMIGCSGERNRTEFVARTDFNNIHLLNDYRLLEDANRLADNAKRDYRIKSGSRPTKKGNILQKAASKNDTKVYRMAKGMKRWKENRSQFNIKEKTIYWTVKFVFVDIEEEIISRHSENEFMEDLLSIYINKDKVTAENKLKFTRYINRDVTVLFKQELDPGESNLRYTAADIHKTLKEILTQKTILEYPVFHIALPRTAQRLKQQPYMREPHVKRNYETSSSSDSESDSSDDDGQTNNKIRKLVDL